MTDKKIEMEITATWLHYRGEHETRIPVFNCYFKNEIQINSDITWKGIDIQLVGIELFNLPEYNGRTFPWALVSSPTFSFNIPNPENLWESDHRKWYEYIAPLMACYQPISDKLKASNETLNTIKGYFYRDGKEVEKVDQGACEIIADTLKPVFESEGYSVTIIIPDYYYPSPTSTMYPAPALNLSLMKTLPKPDIKLGFQNIYTFYSYEKDQTKVQVQYSLLDQLTEEKIKMKERELQEGLTALGVKCLQLVMRECNQNNRVPWFVMDVNHCLDILNYRRNKKGIHLTRNRERFYNALKNLSKIEFNIEAKRKPKWNKEEDTYHFKFRGALLTISRLEVWKGEKATEETKIQDGIKVIVNPDIYGFIEKGWYTVFPDAFLAIDAGRKDHAIKIYHYINNQWRVGLFTHKGVLKEGLLSILERSGALGAFHKKRKNDQRKYITDRIDDLMWLKKQDGLWIKDIKVEAKNRNQFDPLIIATMSDKHPLSNMKIVAKDAKNDKTISR